jgi:hypothetical protein
MRTCRTMVPGGSCVDCVHPHPDTSYRRIHVQYSTAVCIYILKMNRFKFTRGLDPLYGDACSAKSFQVLPLVFSTDRSPIDWLQYVLKIIFF